MDYKQDGLWQNLVRVARHAMKEGRRLSDIDPAPIVAVADQLAKAGPAEIPGAMLHCESMVKSSDLSPEVLLQWGNQEGTVSPTAAIDLGLGIIEAAEIAINDAAVWAWALEVMKGEADRATLLVKHFYSHLAAVRDKYRPEQTHGPTK